MSNNSSLQSSLILIVVGILLGIIGYFTSMINIGGYTLKIFLALPFVGVCIFLGGIVDFIMQCFKKKLWYGFMALIIGLGVIVSLGFGAYKVFFQSESENSSELSPYEKHKIETNAKIDKLNSAEMNTINPFNDKRISITIPTIMIKEIANDSASSISDFEEYYYDDYFRISIERIFKSKIRSDIKNLPDLVIILQQPNNPSDKIIFESDTTNIKCLADENGYNALYYTYTKRNRGTSWGNVVYVEDKKYYYIITTWIGYGYETKLKYLIDKVITSFNIEK